MKKILISIAAVAFVALMISNVYAQCGCVPPPCFPPCRPPGFTPGFWKHNLRVYLEETNGKYSAFEGGPLDGVKLTDEMIDGFLDDIGLFTAEEALAYLKLKGWSTARTNTANWFNWAAGYGPY